MKTDSLKADCLAIVTDARETLWVRSAPTDIKALVDSFSELSQRPENQSRVLYPLLSYTDANGDEKLVELWSPVMTGLRSAVLTGPVPDTTQVEVWHETLPMFGLGPQSEVVSAKAFQHVANLRVHGSPRWLPEDQATRDFALDQAYSSTQNVFCGWHPKGARSTSVGDVLVLVSPECRRAYRVANFGFDEITFGD